MYDLIVIGGGAAGYFAAIQAAESSPRPLRAVILEAGSQPLRKVRISGGGRCNVTHAEFDPAELVTHYPRGPRELRGPFSKFAPGDTMAFFENRGVPLKIEDDGRIFPVSDDSASIVDALQRAAREHRIEVRTKTPVTSLTPAPPHDGQWLVGLRDGSRLPAKRVVLATGSVGGGYRLAASLGLDLVDRVPSLFSFNVAQSDLHDLRGLSVPDGHVRLEGLSVRTRGPILITHWGLSGPAVLRASAEGAVGLHALDYRTDFRVSWTPTDDADEMLAYLEHARREAGGRTLRFDVGLPLPRRLWRYLAARAGCREDWRWADLTAEQLHSLAGTLTADRYRMAGQTRFKEEFVTAGGIDLREVDFTRFALRRFDGLYAAGEVLDIDGVTGGFNFQAAWTGGSLIGRAVAEALAEEG